MRSSFASKMIRVAFQLLFLGVTLYPLGAHASPDTHEVWTGDEGQILGQALKGLTPTDSAEVMRQIGTVKSTTTLEQKLWTIIDHITADGGGNYGDWFVLSAFATVASKSIATDFSANKARSLIQDLEKNLEQVISEAENASEETSITIKDEFTGESVITTKAAVRLQRQTRFTRVALQGSFNILGQVGVIDDAKLAASFKSSSMPEIQTIGGVFEEVILDRFRTPTQPHQGEQ